jgi:hypothetical protein
MGEAQAGGEDPSSPVSAGPVDINQSAVPVLLKRIATEREAQGSADFAQAFIAQPGHALP